MDSKHRTRVVAEMRVAGARCAEVGAGVWAPRRGCVRRSRPRTPPLVPPSRATRTREEAKGDAVRGSVSPDMFSSDLETTLMRSSPLLHRAARWGDVVSVNSLLLGGADGGADTAVDEKDRNGSTPLMWAAQFGHDDVVDVLLANGADPRVTNAFGWTAAEYASTSSVAGDVLPLLLAAEPSLLGARRTVPRDMLGGAGAVKARGSRRTPAVPRDGPASSGNHDEDIRLRRAVPVQALRVSAGARRAIHLSRVLNIRGTPRPSQPFPHPLTEPSFTVRASWARCSRLRTRVRTRCLSHPRDPASPSRCCAQVRKPAAPVSPDRCTPL